MKIQNKNKKIFGYIMIILGILSLIIQIIGSNDFNIALELVFTLIFAVLVASGTTMLIISNLEKKDKNFFIELNDERNLIIRYKTGYLINVINIYLLGIMTIVFILLDYFIPAIISGALVILQPIIMILVFKYVEKRM